MTTEKEQFLNDGFVMKQVLTEEEVADFLALMDDLLDPEKKAQKQEFMGSSLQHLGDPLESFGTQPKQYYIHMLGTSGTQSILHAYQIPGVLSLVEELIGPHPIINNASIFATNPGVAYNLGWHRDIIQIPEEDIRDELFSPEWAHNRGARLI